MASQQIGVLPLGVDLNLYAGDDFYVDLSVTDAGTGGPIDLTGYTPQAQIRTTTESSTVLAEFECTLGESTVALRLHHDDTAMLPPNAVWDVQIMSGDPVDSRITTLAYGKVKTTAEVTRP